MKMILYNNHLNKFDYKGVIHDEVTFFQELRICLADNSLDFLGEIPENCIDFGKESLIHVLYPYFYNLI